MKDQLTQLMEYEGMSPAKFADEIGVQRSSISHILSDRNKPSYDFIIKVIDRFPELNTEWLITGVGNMHKSTNQISKEVKQTSIFDQNSFEKDKVSNKPSISAVNKNKIPAINMNSHDKSNDILVNQNEINSIKQNEFTNVTDTDFVLVFYIDGTFERFKSRK